MSKVLKTREFAAEGAVARKFASFERVWGYIYVVCGKELCINIHIRLLYEKPFNIDDNMDIYYVYPGQGLWSEAWSLYLKNGTERREEQGKTIVE